MAGYAFRTISDRQDLQDLWEHGESVKEISEVLAVPLSTVYAELRRGKTGERLPDMRLKYDAQVAQLNMVEELGRRGRRAAGV
jgi:IS30 family transposase